MIRKIFGGIALTILFFGCSKVTVKNPTDQFLAPTRLAKLEDKKLDEVSGAVASISNQGLFWLHNDSGNGSDLFLVDRNLKIIMTCELQGAENRDWEDITIGPGPVKGKNYIYVGDIGDNEARHSLKWIYRVEEPKFDSLKKVTLTVFDRIVFKLEDKKKDMETLIIDPVTRNLYLVSKREEPVWLYSLPYPQSVTDTLTAKKILELPLTQIVGGDVSVNRKYVLLKNYEHVYYWENKKNEPIEKLLKEKPYEVPYELEPQGEAIAWARDNSGFYTISEKNIGKDSYLYFYKRK
jgi:hypothetical protein